MDENYGCLLLSTLRDKRFPSEFTFHYHVHIIVRRGTMSFSDGKQTFHSSTDDLVIWQMSNNICRVEYSPDFDADFMLASSTFLQHFNPEMVWATKGFIFIRLNPSFHLEGAARELIDSDFRLFRARLSQPDSVFKREVLGRVMQIFLYDMWTVYLGGIQQMPTNDNSSRIFLRFLSLAHDNALREREVSFYADRLCISPKYLSEVSRTVTSLPASQWIMFYSSFELLALLNDTSRTLSEIAEVMNFRSISAFSRYTKKSIGLSPSEYRSRI